MKQKILIIILVFFISCKRDLKSNSEHKNTKEIVTSNNIINKKNDSIVGTNEGIMFLKNFYSKFYFDESKIISNPNKKDFLYNRINDDINSLNSNLKNKESDYDPFIIGEVYNGESIKNTIKFIKETKGFIVTFTNFDEEGEVRLEFELGKNKEGEIKIVNILNDSLLRTK